MYLAKLDKTGFSDFTGRFPSHHTLVDERHRMIFKAGIIIVIMAEVISLTILTVTFGSLFLFFEKSLNWNIKPAFNFGLPIVVALTCQALIGLIVFNDAKKRVWKDEIKVDIWSSLGRSEYIAFNGSLYMSPLLSVAYIVMIMMNDPIPDWWHKKKKASVLFRIITHKAVMDLFSKFNLIAPFIFIGGMLLFALGGALDSGRLSLLAFQVFGGMIIILPPIFSIFHFVVLTHFLSREWIDHSYELFYGRYPVGRWPKRDWLNVQRYYRNVMRNEPNS